MMMEPEASYEGKPVSSDDDWSVIDGQEPQRLNAQGARPANDNDPLELTLEQTDDLTGASGKDADVKDRLLLERENVMSEADSLLGFEFGGQDIGPRGPEIGMELLQHSAENQSLRGDSNTRGKNAGQSYVEEEASDRCDPQSSGAHSSESGSESEPDSASRATLDESAESDTQSGESEDEERGALDLHQDSDLASEDTIAQLERDIRTASKPLTVEPPRTTRHHTIVVVGQPGCGKSTFIECISAVFKNRHIDQLPNKGVYENHYAPLNVSMSADGRIDGVNCTHYFRIQELSNPSDSPHPGSFNPYRRPGCLHGGTQVLDYVHACQKLYLASEEAGKGGPDERIDVCLWFIQNPVRSEAREMARLSMHIPVIPIMAKADALTKTEREVLRDLIVECMTEVASSDSASTHEDWMSPQVPAFYRGSSLNGCKDIYAIASSEIKDYSINRHGWPIRSYPWGVMEPMASNHSDLLSLTHILFELAPEQFKAATEDRYIRFRREQARWQTKARPYWIGFKIALFTLLCFSVFGCCVYTFVSLLAPSNPLSSQATTISDGLNQTQWEVMRSKTNATSASIAAKVNQLLLDEPNAEEWQVTLPLRALQEAQASLKLATGKDGTGAGSVTKNLEAYDKLIASFVLQNARPLAKARQEMAIAHEEMAQQCAKEQAGHISLRREEKGDLSEKEPMLALDFVKNCGKEGDPEGQGNTAPPHKSKFTKRGSKICRRVKKAIKHYHATRTARNKLHRYAEKLQTRVQRHATKFHKRVTGFLKNVNSKRLLRRVLVANAWL